MKNNFKIARISGILYCAYCTRTVHVQGEAIYSSSYGQYLCRQKAVIFTQISVNTGGKYAKIWIINLLRRVKGWQLLNAISTSKDGCIFDGLYCKHLRKTFVYFTVVLSFEQNGF